MDPFIVAQILSCSEANFSQCLTKITIMNNHGCLGQNQNKRYNKCFWISIAQATKNWHSIIRFLQQHGLYDHDMFDSTNVRHSQAIKDYCRLNNLKIEIHTGFKQDDYYMASIQPIEVFGNSTNVIRIYYSVYGMHFAYITSMENDAVPISLDSHDFENAINSQQQELSRFSELEKLRNHRNILQHRQRIYGLTEIEQTELQSLNHYIDF